MLGFQPLLGTPGLFTAPALPEIANFGPKVPKEIWIIFIES
jgi:hypothetical protein